MTAGSVGQIKNGVKTLRYLTTTAIANSVSALIRQFWTASSPNTGRPQKSKSKTSNSTCNADKKLCSELEKRIDREFAEYENAMTEHSAAYVFAKCGEINAMCTCYNLLTIKLVQAADMPCIEYLARFRQPLKVVCDEWIKLDRKHEEAFDSMLQALMESGSAESRSDFDPDWVVKHCSQAMH